MDNNCDFDMRQYPFDVQKCQTTFAIDGNSRLLTRILRGNLSYDGPDNIASYLFENISYIISPDQKNRIVFEIKLGRRILSEVLTTILPTILLLLVTLLIFLKPEVALKSILSGFLQYQPLSTRSL